MILSLNPDIKMNKQLLNKLSPEGREIILRNENRINKIDKELNILNQLELIMDRKRKDE
jgi:hypothetical protein